MTGTVPFKIVVATRAVQAHKIARETTIRCLGKVPGPPAQLSPGLKDFVAPEIVVPGIPGEGGLCRQTQMRPKIFLNLKIGSQQSIV